MRYYLILALISVFSLNACATRSPYPMSINLKGPYSENAAEEVLISTYEAYRRLRVCTELKRHAQEYNRIMKLQQKLNIEIVSNIDVELVKDQIGGDFCAYVWISNNTIYLHPTNFGAFDSGCNYTHTIAHEMLHLGGFDHRNTEETKYFNNLLKTCGF